MSSTSSPTKAILMRAKITEEEWAEIRKAAIDRRLNIGDYVAKLLRAGRQCEDEAA